MLSKHSSTHHLLVPDFIELSHIHLGVEGEIFTGQICDGMAVQILRERKKKEVQKGNLIIAHLIVWKKGNKLPQ